MRHRFRHRLLPWALACVLTAPTLVAQAQPVESIARIQQTATAAVLAQLPPSAQVSSTQVDPRLRLPACSQPPAADAPTLRNSGATVAVRCGLPAWTVYVAVRISDIRPIVVLDRSGTRGDLLDDSMLILQSRDVAQLPFGFMESIEEAEGLQLRRPLPAGTPLTPNDVEAQALVQRGDLVTMIGRSGGLVVRAAGKALAGGAAGERVRVQNEGSRRIVEGVVTAPGVVEIGL